MINDKKLFIFIFIALIVYLSYAGRVEKNEINCINEKDSRPVLLDFINDKIPIFKYNDKIVELYYSNIADKNVVIENTKYYILDMDGDGKDEYGIYVYPNLIFFRYNEDKKNFVEYLSLNGNQKPIGTGKVYGIITSQPLIYEYFEYDKEAQIIKQDYYRVGEEFDEITKKAKVLYEINGERVSYEVWENKTKEFFKEVLHAVKPVKYRDLLNYK